MNVDIRIPIGGMFSIIGLVLIVYGLVTFGNAELYQRSLSVNINLIWGLVMLAFGVSMLYFGYRAKGEGGRRKGERSNDE
jgi:uncharacterized membrane protein